MVTYCYQQIYSSNVWNFLRKVGGVARENSVLIHSLIIISPHNNKLLPPNDPLFGGGGGGIWMFSETSIHLHLYLTIQDLSKLKEMFPSETEAALENVLDFSLNVEDAIDTLVNKPAGQYPYEVILCSCLMSVGSILCTWLHVVYMHSKVKFICTRIY